MTLRLLSHTLTVLVAVSYVTLAAVDASEALNLWGVYGIFALVLVALNLKTEHHGPH